MSPQFDPKRLYGADDSQKQIAAPKVTVEGGTSSFKPNNVDIVFTIDTTGSMNDKIEALLQTCEEFVEEPAKFNLHPSFALVSFGDISIPGTDKIEVVVSPTDSIEKIKHGLRHIPRNSGYGNTGESSFEAIVESMKLQFRSETVKVLILITDEPAHQKTYKPEQIRGMLTEGNFLVYSVATRDWYYKDIAEKNGGEWREIAANSSLEHIKKLFRELAPKIAKMSDAVLELGDGDVQKTMLMLSSGGQ